MSFLYLAALVLSLTGMVLLDRRYRLSFWADARAAAVTLIISVTFFLAWDIAGVFNGIFFRGTTQWMTGLLVADEVPVEEVFFLTLLTYLTMNVFGALRRRESRGTTT